MSRNGTKCQNLSLFSPNNSTYEGLNLLVTFDRIMHATNKRFMVFISVQNQAMACRMATDDILLIPFSAVAIKNQAMIAGVASWYLYKISYYHSVRSFIKDTYIIFAHNYRMSAIHQYDTDGNVIFDEIFVIVCTVICQNETFQCRQWRKCHLCVVIVTFLWKNKDSRGRGPFNEHLL